MRPRMLETRIPDPTPVLFFVAASSALLYSMDKMSWAAFVLPAIFLLPALVYAMSASTTAAMAALVASAALPRFFLELGGLKARPEHIVIGLLLFIALWMYKRGTVRLRWIFADVLLFAYVALNFYSSLFRSIDPGQTTKWALQQVLVIAAYFLVRVLADNQERLRTAVHIVLLTGALEGVYAVICFFSNRLLGTAFGVEIGQYEDIPGIFGTQYEANILGSYSGACLIIMLVMYFRKNDKRLLWGIACTLAGLVISLSRAAALATLVALFVFLLYALRAKIISIGPLVRVGATVLAVVLILAPLVVPIYQERFSTVDVSDPSADDNTRVRLITLAPALDNIAESPVFGNGTSSFQLTFSYKEAGIGNPEDTGWIANTELRVLHDTGVVGAIAFAWFTFYLFFRGARLARRVASPELTGILLSCVVYLVSFQATEGTLLAFSWVHLGLIAAFLAVYKDNGLAGEPEHAMHAARS